MKCMFWKCSILAAALGILMALGAFAEGTLGLAASAACILGAVYAMRWFWAMEQRAERQAAHRRKARIVPRGASDRSSETCPRDTLQAAS